MISQKTFKILGSVKLLFGNVFEELGDLSMKEKYNMILSLSQI